MISVLLLMGRKIMLLDEIPKFFHPEDFALEDAWREIRNQNLADAASVRSKLATTIVALAAIGETDPVKLKRFGCTPPEEPSNMQREHSTGGKPVKWRLLLNRARSGRNVGIRG
jgi:hypothetical protein